MTNPVSRGTRNPLSNEQILAVAPSVFAGSPYEKVSEKYAFIPTFKVINAMRQNGFVPTKAEQTISRISGKTPYARHMIRFSAGEWNPTKVGEEDYELILINGHDGSTAYKLFLGIHVFACLNGLVTSEGLSESISIRHSGNVVDEVLEASVSMIEHTNDVKKTVAEWKTIELDTPETELLATQALALRYDEKSPIGTRQALMIRREADAKSNLWTVFNRLQENLTQGGIVPFDAAGRRARNNGRLIGKTRPVKGITENVKLNRALFALAEGFAKLKKG